MFWRKKTVIEFKGLPKTAGGGGGPGVKRWQKWSDRIGIGLIVGVFAAFAVRYFLGF